MPTIESRPFLVPREDSVRVRFSAEEPSAPLEELDEHWQPGQRIVVRVSATLDQSFWTDTRIGADESVDLVAIAVCPTARTRWTARANFALVEEGQANAVCHLVIDGSLVASQVSFDAWIVGTGRVDNTGRAQSLHQAAKLWQLTSPLSVSLEPVSPGFPITAVSFRETNRRAVPWSVEIDRDAEPSWSISASIRMYVNSDMHIIEQLLDGTAPLPQYALMESDVHLAVLNHLEGLREIIEVGQIAESAADSMDTLAALGESISNALGLPLGEAMRLAREEPTELIARSREALRFYREESL